VAETTLTGTMVAEVMAELADLEEPKTREVNEKHGDDHGVNLSKLRALAKRHCLAQIGIEHAEYRARAIDIGERLGVLKDYPTSPGCTSPLEPVWITEMVRRQHDN